MTIRKLRKPAPLENANATINRAGTTAGVVLLFMAALSGFGYLFARDTGERREDRFKDLGSRESLPIRFPELVRRRRARRGRRVATVSRLRSCEPQIVGGRRMGSDCLRRDLRRCHQRTHRRPRHS